MWEEINESWDLEGLWDIGGVEESVEESVENEYYNFIEEN
jgi:hypothetical protein